VSPEEYMQRAVELGHTTYFTTEHGFQGNLFEAQTLCDKYKLKLIYGVEAYYVDDICDKTDRRSFHLILIGLTEKARYEINRILSIANTDGFYYKPRIGLKELLSLTPTETIVTTACVAGRMFKPKLITTTEEIVGWEEVEELIDDHDPDAGTRKRNKPIYKTEIEGPDSWYTDFFVPVKNHFKDNFYLEVQAHNDPSQIEYNKKILEVARRTNTKIIHACDSHYIYPKDSRNRDLFLSAKDLILNLNIYKIYHFARTVAFILVIITILLQRFRPCLFR
jgi:DNA polymerase III alpha subunit